jgi:hypothetical protein
LPVTDEGIDSAHSIWRLFGEVITAMFFILSVEVISIQLSQRDLFFVIEMDGLNLRDFFEMLTISNK